MSNSLRSIGVEQVEYCFSAVHVLSVVSCLRMPSIQGVGVAPGGMMNLSKGLASNQNRGSL